MTNSANIESIWSGVYERFADVPLSTEVFNSDIWTKKQQDRVLALFYRLKSQASGVQELAVSRDYPLSAFLAGMMSDNDRISVIDYGGSMGQTYLQTISQLPHVSKNLFFTVVETQAVVENIPTEISEFPNLKFVSSTDTVPEKCDVVHCGSVIQYIENWKEFFDGMIAKFNPKAFVLSDLLVGDLPSFVTSQRYYNQVMAVQFLNIDEFLAYWKKTPYRLCFQSNFFPLSGTDYFPNHDLPPSHRLKNPVHMIFQRVT